MLAMRPIVAIPVAIPAFIRTRPVVFVIYLFQVEHTNLQQQNYEVVRCLPTVSGPAQGGAHATCPDRARPARAQLAQ